MDPLITISPRGHVIELQRSDPRHLAGSTTKPLGGAADRVTPDFGAMLFEALGNVNDLQHRTMDLTEAMITDPDSVDIHDVTVAIAEANLALSMTKAIMDRAIQAYKTIVNTR
jgi:flagellar hook-basal body complex protein FliE